MREIFGKRRNMHVPPPMCVCVCLRELPTSLVMNRSSFLLKLGYVVVFGSLLPVSKLKQDYRIGLVLPAVKKLKHMTSKLVVWFSYMGKSSNI